jgi:hypothetical protein
MDHYVKQRNPNSFTYNNLENLYMENIWVNASDGASDDFRVITQGVSQGCPVSLVLFNLYLDEVFRTWLTKLKTSRYFKELIFITLLFEDDQFIISDTQDNLQQAVYLLHIITKEYNLEIATRKRRYLVLLGQTI